MVFLYFMRPVPSVRRRLAFALQLTDEKEGKWIVVSTGRNRDQTRHKGLTSAHLGSPTIPARAANALLNVVRRIAAPTADGVCLVVTLAGTANALRLYGAEGVGRRGGGCV